MVALRQILSGPQTSKKKNKKPIIYIPNGPNFDGPRKMSSFLMWPSKILIP